MPRGQEFYDLEMPKCCTKCLADIDERMKLSKMLSATLVASPFVIMIGNPVETLFTVLTTDWDELTKAVRTVPEITRRRAYDLAVLHSFDHPGGKLNEFWTTMAETFR